MLLNYFSIIGALLLCIMRPTLADVPGCYPDGEKFSNIVKQGDIYDIIDDFCTGGSRSYNYGSHINVCWYWDNTYHTVVFNVQFGNYPNVDASENITFTEDTCKKVLTHKVKEKCNNRGGELDVVYINGSFSEDPSPLRRMNSRDQSLDGNNGDSSDDTTEGHDGHNEYNRGDIDGSGASVTSTATVASTSTMTTTITEPPPVIVTSFITSTVSAQQQETNETNNSTSTTGCHSILVALASFIGQTVICGISSQTSTSSTSTSSTSTSSTSSAINTNDFYGTVKIDPQWDTCPDM